ncbi:Daunorubicin/doxorubicin resistance ATP-binding protein DrrA [Planctomycetales bacterium 10988]|nr:Daunorubicin/doxorubicin resistance ATP-binding protein DrrA [Planctomycetales bacterium 10988]
MIEINNFSKRYGKFTAVEDLSLKIEEGEVFGFIGPNGAGKSTTIRFLATLLKATSGDGMVNGYSVSKQPMDVRRSIGYMPDSFGVYDGMKVWEFLDFFAVAYQIPKSQRRKIIADVLDLLNLNEKNNEFVNSLSRGMKQRLCLAKTLVHNPPVLILDEPASGLDPRARLEVKALLKELRQMGKTILISSHILAELADCCTSIGILERGQILMQGPIDEVYRKIRRHRTLRIHVQEMLDQTLRIVRSDPHTESVEVQGNFIFLEFQGNETEQRVLLNKIVQAEIPLLSFSEKEPTLEDVFMLVTNQQ